MTPLEKAFVQHPPSEEICKQLNEIGAWECAHGRRPCFLRCGVKRIRSPGEGAYWVPISHAERVEWLEAVTGKNRCICVGNSNWCSHIGPCREDRFRGVSDAYCEKCLANAKAESQ